MSTPLDPVLIRVWHDDASDVFALFPAAPADIHGTLCTCYQHVGQHGSADYLGCMSASRPATAEEAAPLLAELRQRGYNPKIIRRASPALHNQRREAARSIA